MEKNKARVKIFGQNYVITGEKQPEEIGRIGEYVDGKMKLISKVIMDGTPGKTAVLASINIAEEYFDALEQIKALKIGKAQVEADSMRYLQMWEDAKKNFILYKENALKMQEQNTKTEEKNKQLEEKCKEFENSFFDLQMENIRLKSLVEKYEREQEAKVDNASEGQI